MNRRDLGCIIVITLSREDEKIKMTEHTKKIAPKLYIKELESSPAEANLGLTKVLGEDCSGPPVVTTLAIGEESVKGK